MTGQLSRARRIETIVEQMESPNWAARYRAEVARRVALENENARLRNALNRIAVELARAEYEPASAALRQTGGAV